MYKEITETPEQAFVVEKVLDWNSRIEGYTQAQKNKYKTAIEKMEELENILKDDSKDWYFSINDKKKNLTCEQR